MDFCSDESRCQMETRCELKRTERPTPQIWSAVRAGEGSVSPGTRRLLVPGRCVPKHVRGAQGSRRLTFVYHALQFLADSQQLYPRPEIRTDAFRYPECPAAAVDVAPVLPDGLEARFEEIDGLAHLDLLDWGVVVVPPKVLDRLDLGSELLELGLVAAIVGLLLLLRLPGAPRIPMEGLRLAAGSAPAFDLRRRSARTLGRSPARIPSE